MFIFLFLHSCINLCNFFLYLGIGGGVYLLITERNDSLSIASEISRINQNIAAAYTACSEKGAVMPIAENSDHLADTINSIQQGGNVEVLSKYVDFIDTDGTILYSYTEAEVQELTELPPLPERQGYTYQEWNWSLADIKAYGFPLTVGAVRIPTDGKTHITIDLLYGGSMVAWLGVSIMTGQQITVEWGDGTTEVLTTNRVTHRYASAGQYEIIIDSNQAFTLNPFSQNRYMPYFITKADIGLHCDCNTSTFYNCANLEEISIPMNESLSAATFDNCNSLKSITIPSTSASVPSFKTCRSLKTVSLPKNDIAFAISTFESCQSIKRFSFPKNQTVICRGLMKGCASLQSLFIPESVSEIQDSAFYNCRAVNSIDLSALTSVPTLESTSAIPTDAVLLVRNAEMLAAFQSAADWSSFAARMQIGGKYAET